MLKKMKKAVTRHLKTLFLFINGFINDRFSNNALVSNADR